MEQSELESKYVAHSHLKDGIIDLAAGTIGGIANVYAGQPLDTVKVKMQAFPGLYRSGVTCFRDTFILDGIRGLYAGTVPALVANIAENAVLFCAYGYCQKAVGYVTGCSEVKELSILENAVSGGLASVFAALVLCPTELVKCRLQSQREVNPTIHSTPLSVCRDAYRMHGFRSFFVGMTPTLSREVPGYFTFFGAYEACRYYLAPKGKTKDEIGLFRTAVSGAVGGMTLWTVVFPFDSIKSRMQIAGSGKFGKLLTQIIRDEGIKVLYKGLLPTLIRTCLASGCLFVAFEESKKFMTAIF